LDTFTGRDSGRDLPDDCHVPNLLIELLLIMAMLREGVPHEALRGPPNRLVLIVLARKGDTDAGHATPH
jgi:hypothetical protein